MHLASSSHRAKTLRNVRPAAPLTVAPAQHAGALT